MFVVFTPRYHAGEQHPIKGYRQDDALHYAVLAVEPGKDAQLRVQAPAPYAGTYVQRLTIQEVPGPARMISMEEYQALLAWGTIDYPVSASQLAASHAGHDGAVRLISDCPHTVWRHGHNQTDHAFNARAHRDGDGISVAVTARNSSYVLTASAPFPTIDAARTWAHAARRLIVGIGGPCHATDSSHCWSAIDGLSMIQRDASDATSWMSVRNWVAATQVIDHRHRFLPDAVYHLDHDRFVVKQVAVSTGAVIRFWRYAVRPHMLPQIIIPADTCAQGLERFVQEFPRNDDGSVPALTCWDVRPVHPAWTFCVDHVDAVWGAAFVPAPARGGRGRLTIWLYGETGPRHATLITRLYEQHAAVCQTDGRVVHHMQLPDLVLQNVPQ